MSCTWNFKLFIKATFSGSLEWPLYTGLTVYMCVYNIYIGTRLPYSWENRSSYISCNIHFNELGYQVGWSDCTCCISMTLKWRPASSTLTCCHSNSWHVDIRFSSEIYRDIYRIKGLWIRCSKHSLFINLSWVSHTCTRGQKKN